MENNKNQRLRNIFKKCLFLRGNKDEKPEKGAKEEVATKETPKKSSAAEKRQDMTVESKETKPQPPKVKPIQKKQRKIVNVEKAKRIEDEEKEEFEVVQNARPAVCHPLNAKRSKLQWKQEDPPQSESDTEQAAHDEPTVEKTQEKQMDPLKDAVAELTLEKQQMKEVIENLRKKLRRKNKLIEELRKELGKEAEQTQEEKEPKEQKEGEPLKQLRQELEEAKTALKAQMEKTKADKEEIMRLRKKDKKEEKAQDPAEEDKVIDEATLAVAKRTLELMKRNQLLENALGYKETSDLRNFFSSAAPNTPPTDNVLALLDKAMTVAMDSLSKRPHDLDDIIDNPMRRFLNNPTAKETLLETMLSAPGMMPSSWAVEGAQKSGGKAKDGKKDFVKSVYL